MGGLIESLLTGPPGRRDGTQNAAAAPRDFGVARPLQTLFELVRATTTEYQMGMAIDQPRREHAPLPAQAAAALDLRRQHRHRHHFGDLAVAHQYRHGGVMGTQAIE